MQTHRAIQLADLMDRASTERVRYYINAIKASDLHNSGAAILFTRKAQQWERIRIAAAYRLFKYPPRGV